MKTEQNIEKLAHDIVDGWDLDTLLEYAQDTHEEWLNNMSAEEFTLEWDTFYGEEEEDSDIISAETNDTIIKALKDGKIKLEERGGCDHTDCSLKYRPIVFSVYDENFTNESAPYSETTYCPKHILEMLD